MTSKLGSLHFADGIARMLPMIIFRGKGTRLGTEKLRYHDRVLMEFNPTAYMNDVPFEKYLTHHLIPALGSRPTLFALDLMGSHKTSAILQLFRTNNITPFLIPAGCTSLVYPLNVSINKPFKGLMRDITDEKIFELESASEFEK